MKCFAPDTKILMEDKSYKEIQDIKLNDETAWGCVLGITQHIVPGESLMLYGKTVVTDQHPVLTKAGWVTVEELKHSVNAGIKGDVVVFDLITEKHRIETPDAIFSDYEGYDGVGAQWVEEVLEVLNASL